MKLTEMFPSPWLKADDVGDGIRLTVKGVIQELVGKEQELKPVIHWQEDSKPLILNRTNGKDIAKIHGDDTEDWAGKEINLIHKIVEVAGETYQAVRVEPEITF